MSAVMIANLLFGFVFVMRTRADLCENCTDRRGALTKIGTLAVIILTLAAIFGVSWPLTYIFVHHAALLMLTQLMRRQFRRIPPTDEQCCAFIAFIILKMKAGHALNVALIAVTKRFPQLPTSGSTAFTWIHQELQRARCQPHMALEILESLRRDLRQNFEFRRRSGQILMQVRAQALMLGFMYSGLLLLVFCRTQFRGLSGLIFLSLAMFACGVLWLMRLGRSVKWSL